MSLYPQTETRPEDWRTRRADTSCWLVIPRHPSSLADNPRAFLERILLDDVGRIRPQFDLDNTSDDAMEGAHDSPVRLPVDEKIGIETATPGSAQLDDYAKKANDISPPISVKEKPSNPRKRKLPEPVFATALLEFEDVDIADHLPSQQTLIKLVEYFCTSFHHWIPYLHKQRLCDTVSGLRSETRSDLVLHALVAVTLRHMDQQSIGLEDDEILRQTKISRFIVGTLALRTMSLESLQALILIVFDYVSTHKGKGPMYLCLTECSSAMVTSQKHGR